METAASTETSSLFPELLSITAIIQHWKLHSSEITFTTAEASRVKVLPLGSVCVWGGREEKTLQRKNKVYLCFLPKLEF